MKPKCLVAGGLAASFLTLPSAAHAGRLLPTHWVCGSYTGIADVPAQTPSPGGNTTGFEVGTGSMLRITHAQGANSVVFSGSAGGTLPQTEAECTATQVTLMGLGYSIMEQCWTELGSVSVQGSWLGGCELQASFPWNSDAYAEDQVPFSAFLSIIYEEGYPFYGDSPISFQSSFQGTATSGPPAAIALLSQSSVSSTIPILTWKSPGVYSANDAPVNTFSAFTSVAAYGGVKAVFGDFWGLGRPSIALTGGFYGGVPWQTIPLAEYVPSSGSFQATNDGITSGDTAFTTYATQPGAQAVSGDFNGDGVTDLALIGGAGWNTIPIAFSYGDGDWYAENRQGPIVGGDLPNFATLATEPGVKAVSGDFNCDGLADIALVATSPSLGWWTVPIAVTVANSSGQAVSPGTFYTYNYGVNGPSPTSTAFLTAATRPGAEIVSGDFNGDGCGDLAVISSTGANGATIPILFSWGFNGPNFGAITSSYDGTTLGWMATTLGETSGDTGFTWDAAQPGARTVLGFGDYDGDGLADLALVGGAHWTTVPMAFSNGDGSFHGANNGVAGWSGYPSFASGSGVVPIGGP